jgi:16S rRNA (guanine527-N7)-methyltransferase
VLATTLPLVSVVLLDSQHRRCDFLREAVEALGIAEHCRVAEGRAEELARQPDLRGAFDVVTARSFGPPATTAECAVGFLATGGTLLVTEPPPAIGTGDADPVARWPDDGLALLGLAPAEFLRRGETTVARMILPDPVLERWPRRVGVPSKRPLWKALSRRST